MTIYTCRDCGETFDNFGALGSHRKAHRRDERGEAPRVVASPRRTRRIESMAGPDPSPGPAMPPTTDGPEPPRAGPSVAAPVVRITPEARAASARELVVESFTVEVFADLLVSLSRAVSELDGAGEAGTLSRVQAAQVAVLLHDSTVDLILDRFKGDVSRFKAALAILLVVLTKGAVHARAIRDRIAERSAEARARAALDVATGEADDAGEPYTPQGLNLRRMSPEDAYRINNQ